MNSMVVRGLQARLALALVFVALGLLATAALYYSPPLLLELLMGSWDRRLAQAGIYYAYLACAKALRLAFRLYVAKQYLKAFIYVKKLKFGF
ncbi:unnamed protein product [Plutella xylostella]|nr:unnamed protein product [Plutella xylostella]